ncbi:(Fe-S)-binding protein [Chloroflexota bacterium]
MPAAEEIAEVLQRCNKCGLCLAGCPIYKVTGVEWTTARGRITLIRSALLDHQLEISELKEPVYNCLTCNGCVEHCPAGVMTGEIIFKAREEMAKQRRLPLIQWLVVQRLLANPSFLNTASKLLRLADVAGLRQVARKTGLMKLLGDVGKAEYMMRKVPPGSGLDDLIRFTKKIEKPKYRVAYFAGCFAPNFAPGKAEATIRVLNKHQAEVVVPKFACCGLPAAGYGDMTTARRLACTNIDIASKLNVDAIVTACASCSSFLKEYTKHLAIEPEWAEKAKEFVSKVKDISEFLIDIGLVTEMGTIKEKVTWHDPCHLGRYQKIKAQPRTVLKSIPGVEFIELGEAGMCCGAAGTYGFKNYDLSMKVLARKMSNVDKTGADILVSSCPACVMQLSYGVNRQKMPMRVLEIVELLDHAYQAVKKDVH